MKKINRYVLILAITCCISFISFYGYVDSSEDTHVNLPQGFKSADEEAVNADTAQDESSITTQKEFRGSDATSNRQEPGSSPDPRLSMKKTMKKSLPKGHDLAELRAYVDKSTITIGEKVTYTLEIDADNDLKIEFPSYVTGLGGFVVKDFGKDEKRIGRNRTRKKQWYLLDTYTTGSYVIPQQQITAELPDGRRETLKSPEIFVEVKSVIVEKEEKAGLRDIKGPLIVSKGVPVILITAILLIILVAAGLILWKLYLKRVTAQRKEPAPTPDEIAFRELERIEGLGLLEKSKIKEYYYLVSLALRAYLENRFSLKAPEQTTEEFLESIVNSDKLEGRHINILKEYLNHCDLVKYAKFDPGKAQAKSLIDTTRRFIDETAKNKEEDNMDKAQK
ncbi:MAG: hypothetical protein DRP74_02355 [Candidatus Omnitrophota bacterium]|nr:MAG: hypothetical protein DRP74_02355 [Candidatus Omnitrophota bacterium]